MRDRERYGNGMEALLRVEHLKNSFTEIQMELMY